MELNYYEIGQRIRRYRKACGLSQEQLAEKAAISPTHMSHIETGSTKLSLPVFIKIADILSIQTDSLLSPGQPDGSGERDYESAGFLFCKGYVYFA